MATVSNSPVVPSVRRATLADLYRVEGKAELIDGRIWNPMASGHLPTKAAMRVAARLDEYAAKVGRGEAYADGIGYAMPEPLSNGRESFSPDASYHVGPLPQNKMRFIVGAPIFAIEVRSEDDYGPTAERDMASKRADYFEAGTQIVWDVDPVARTIASYRPAMGPTVKAQFYSAGESATAEPELPGWSIALNDVFRASATSS